MHSNRATNEAVPGRRPRQFARLTSVDRLGWLGGRIAYGLPPAAERGSHGGTCQPPKRGKANDESPRACARAGVAHSRRSGHRIGNVRLVAAVRGHRQRGRWRRRLSSFRPSLKSRARIARVALIALYCLCAAAGQALADEGVYRRPIGNDPATLDPVLLADVYGRAVAQQIFDGLVSFDQTLAIAPSLAQVWRASADGLTWTFTLRKGVRFHHGREVTADDVVYSLTRVLDPRLKSTAADLFTNIRGAPEFQKGQASRVAGLSAL